MVRERWRPVVGYEQYYSVSSHGRVKSLERFVRHWTGKTMSRRRERILKPGTTTWGYLGVVLCVNGGMDNHRVHHLVANAFIAFRPKGKEINHIDSDRKNNSLENLEWVTRTENMIHAAQKGKYGKLMPAQVKEIRCRLAAGELQCVIANDYGMSQATVSSIKTRTTWSHV